MLLQKKFLPNFEKKKHEKKREYDGLPETENNYERIRPVLNPLHITDFTLYTFHNQ